MKLFAVAQGHTIHSIEESAAIAEMEARKIEPVEHANATFRGYVVEVGFQDIEQSPFSNNVIRIFGRHEIKKPEWLDLDNDGEHRVEDI